MRFRRSIVLALAAALLLAGGCAVLEEQERRWIFQPSKESWGGGWQADGIDEVWIDFESRSAGAPVRLHGLWLPQADTKAPLLLYLHGARWDVRSSAGRMRRMHALGFSVLGVDYRGFGRSTDVLPSETLAHEDALAAWQWLARQRPDAPRVLYGHSLGSAIAVALAADAAVPAPAGLVLEGAFTSIPELIAASKYGWLPIGPLVTQRFDSASRVAALKVPLIVVHGSEDRMVPAALGRALFERATAPKRFVLVEGGSHHNASALAIDDVRAAMAALFRLDASFLQ
jgi:uncharacterized protein